MKNTCKVFMTIYGLFTYIFNPVCNTFTIFFNDQNEKCQSRDLSQIVLKNHNNILQGLRLRLPKIPAPTLCNARKSMGQFQRKLYNMYKLKFNDFQFLITLDESSSVLVNIINLVLKLMISTQYFTYLKFLVDPSTFVWSHYSTRTGPIQATYSA